MKGEASRKVDILIPTFERPGALAVTLAGLVGQTFRGFAVIVSDQSDWDTAATGEVAAVVRVLRARGHEVQLHRHVPPRGMAEHRQFLLDQAVAPYVLFLDDDVLLEPDVLERMVAALEQEGCGFGGCGLIGLTYAAAVRPHEQQVEFWDGPVRPEDVSPGTPAWDRHKLHNAANLLHLQSSMGREGDRKYKVAWIGGCVLYDREKLIDCGGFSFWPELPHDHAGEDVLAQLRVMRRYGGFGLLPSGAYHLELPTTLPIRTVDAPELLH
ncbi:MAG: glycosyltransferase family 2 protein [Actinomycetota bacterium]|nr:glycosyltransferase family 2 protein [Actinomycetota bacterium]